MIDTSELRMAIKNKEYWKYADVYILIELCNEIDRLRRERDEVTRDFNNVRIKANDLEVELSYRKADVQRLRDRLEKGQ